MREVMQNELELLTAFERVAFRLAEFGNRPACKPLLHRFLASVGRTWVKIGSGNLQRLSGLEHVRDLQPDRGVLLVSNHRSFFDMYVLSSVLLHESSFIRRMYFPVRSTFFYQRPLGVVVNFWLAMMSMYPPILREKERKVFNRFSIEFLIEALRQPGTLVGYHPEGTRNKSGEGMLPAQPGVGEMAYHSQPVVIPVFISGLNNDIVSQVRGNFDGTGGPIDIRFGAPVELEKLYAREASPETYQAIADKLRSEILKLSPESRRGQTAPTTTFVRPRRAAASRSRGDQIGA